MVGLLTEAFIWKGGILSCVPEGCHTPVPFYAGHMYQVVSSPHCYTSCSCFSLAGGMLAVRMELKSGKLDFLTGLDAPSVVAVPQKACNFGRFLEIESMVVYRDTESTSASMRISPGCP